MSNNNHTLDIAVVGGGIAGLYTAWRLINNQTPYKNLRIAVFEATDRLGGRLWSSKMDAKDQIDVELGGMFFSNDHHLVYDLCVNKLSLEPLPVSPKPAFAYIRGNRFRIPNLPRLNSNPYTFNSDEQNLTYHEILFHGIRQLVPSFDDLWPLDPDANFTDTIRYLRSTQFNGAPLHEWGFRDLLANVLSDEALACVRHLVGSESLLGNWNAYDALLSMLRNLTGNGTD